MSPGVWMGRTALLIAYAYIIQRGFKSHNPDLEPLGDSGIRR